MAVSLAFTTLLKTYVLTVSLYLPSASKCKEMELAWFTATLFTVMIPECSPQGVVATGTFVDPRVMMMSAKWWFATAEVQIICPLWCVCSPCWHSMISRVKLLNQKCCNYFLHVIDEITKCTLLYCRFVVMYLCLNCITFHCEFCAVIIIAA